MKTSSNRASCGAVIETSPSILSNVEYDRLYAPCPSSFSAMPMAGLPICDRAFRWVATVLREAIDSAYMAIPGMVSGGEGRGGGGGGGGELVANKPHSRPTWGRLRPAGQVSGSAGVCDAVLIAYWPRSGPRTGAQACLLEPADAFIAIAASH